RPAAANVRITLTAIDESAGAMSVPANADGTFTVEDVPPGKYEVTAAGGGNVWVVASAMTAGGDALDLLLDVPRERDVRDLTITFEEHAAELAGQALDGSGRPALD